MNLAIFRYQIQLYYPTIPYFVIICSIGGKTKCVKMNETLNQWKAL